jgi:Skp family chaperone for outer membrane proteins
MPQQSNSTKDIMGNEENEYPVPDPNNTMINITNEFNDDHKKSLKEEIMDEIMEKLHNMVNQKVQDALNKYQGNTNKKLEKIQKQINELSEDFNKQQSETKETIKKRYLKYRS